MATGMHMDERSVDYLVLSHHDQDRKVSAKSVTMRAMTLCKNLSGYRELLLSSKPCNGDKRVWHRLFYVFACFGIVAETVWHRKRQINNSSIALALFKPIVLPSTASSYSLTNAYKSNIKALDIWDSPLDYSKFAYRRKMACHFANNKQKHFKLSSPLLIRILHYLMT